MNKNRKEVTGTGKYIEKSRLDYPLLTEKIALLPKAKTVKIFYMKNTQPDYIHNGNEIEPAMDMARTYAVNIMGGDSYPEWKKEAKREIYFLVGENERIAKKVACLLSALHELAFLRCGSAECCDEEEEDEDWFGFNSHDVARRQAKVAEFDLSVDASDKDEFKDLNVYAARILTAMEGYYYGFFKGLGEGTTIKDQMGLVDICPARLKFVWLNRKTAESPEILEYVNLNPESFSMIELDEPDQEYYYRVCKNLLSVGDAEFKDEEELRYAVNKMKKNAGTRFSEEWIGCFLDRGVSGKKFDLKKMFSCYDDNNGETNLERLNKMIGLKNVKDLVKELQALVSEECRNQNLKMHNNMIFAGNPGSGKTISAELISKIQAEIGAKNSVFVVATRSDLVGRFIGHTAPKVREAFNRARGGVLFVDEADFFLGKGNGNGDDFVREAIKEFVRYMEIYPDVTVIFAMYSSAVEDFLQLDDGLRSRISRIVKFDDYNAGELSEITEYILKEKGYVLKGGKNLIKEYFESETQKDNFGNARAARKLAETIILSKALSRMNSHDSGEDKDVSNDIKRNIVEQAIQRYKRENQIIRNNLGMGFLQSGGKVLYASECWGD